jgi:8-oxo-dGTP diphosphatase
VIAIASNNLEGHELNDESHEVRWVALDDVERLPLHPSFARSWPALRLAMEDAIERAI